MAVATSVADLPGVMAGVVVGRVEPEVGVCCIVFGRFRFLPVADFPFPALLSLEDPIFVRKLDRLSNCGSEMDESFPECRWMIGSLRMQMDG